MRVLLVGTMPPPGGVASRSFARLAARLCEEGNDVEVLSPDLRSAAHRHAPLRGVFLAMNLVFLARRFDALVLRLESDLPLRNDTQRLARAVTLASLGWALSLWKDVTIRLDTPLPLPGGAGGRPTRQLWARATSVVVCNEEDRDVICTVPYVDEHRVVVEEPEPASRFIARADWSIPDEDHLSLGVAQMVRERAARDRLVNTARVDLGEEGVGPLAQSAFPAAEGSGLGAMAQMVADRTRRALGARLRASRGR